MTVLPSGKENKARQGLAYYLKKDYPAAKKCFDEYFRHKKPGIQEIVNYSAVLIALGQYDTAVEWCEKHITNYPDDYLLNANLACAYAHIDPVKSLYYFMISRSLNPDYEPSMHGVLENVEKLVHNIPNFLSEIRETGDKRELSSKLIMSLQCSVKSTLNLTIPDLEMKIVRTINKAIQLLSETPKSLVKKSENELSDDIKNNLKMSFLTGEGIEIEREAPQGYARAKAGELDLFLYRTGECYENIATGENKEWAPEKFNGQLKQLLGYLREEGGFGFTIIFNKHTRLETVLKGRQGILQNFYVQIDGQRYFEREGPIIDMSIYSPDLRGVLLTRHKNPEIDNSFVRIYHFIVNAYRPEREAVAHLIRC